MILFTRHGKVEVEVVPMTFDGFARAFLACYFGFVALHYTVRLLALRARCGFSYAEPGPKGTANHRHQSIFKIFRAAIFGICVIRVGVPEVDAGLLMIDPLARSPAVVGTGIVMMIIALGAVDYLHSFLEADWRSGTGGKLPTRLITDGPYGATRNPIFLAVMLGQLGFFLALPSVFSLVCLVAGAVVLIRQARVEEQTLARHFGSTYEAYRMRTPRWLPGLSHRRDEAGAEALGGGPVRPTRG
jgi:protein-S-isoprenylcysteine O-methyltransferase Ste14